MKKNNITNKVLLLISLVSCLFGIVFSVTSFCKREFGEKYAVGIVVLNELETKYSKKDVLERINIDLFDNVANKIADEHVADGENINGDYLLSNTKYFFTIVTGFNTLAINYYSFNAENITIITKYISEQICKMIQFDLDSPTTATYTFDDVKSKNSDSFFSLASIIFSGISCFVLVYLCIFSLKKQLTPCEINI